MGTPSQHRPGAYWCSETTASSHKARGSGAGPSGVPPRRAGKRRENHGGDKGRFWKPWFPNGALVTLPLLAKSLAAAAAKYPHPARGRKTPAPPQRRNLPLPCQKSTSPGNLSPPPPSKKQKGNSPSSGISAPTGAYPVNVDSPLPYHIPCQALSVAQDTRPLILQLLCN